MEKIVTLVTTGKATVSQGRHDDDFADRLSSRYTPLILIVFTILVTIQQLVRNPITCWAPVHFTGNHEKYANNYCWVRNTYYLPYEDQIPRPNEDRQMLTYYQWIQFILLGQAIFFFAPTLIWRTFNSKAGVDADNILQTAHKIPQVNNADKKDEMVEYLAKQIDRFLESRKPGQTCQCDCEHLLSGVLCRCCGRRLGNYLVILYIVQKVLFILNIILQFVALSAILGNKFYIYGAEVVSDPIPDHEWNSAHYVAFPRVTMCDVHIRRLGNLHRYTLQCVLPLNLYIEKIYIFQWFWMVFVLFMLICTFVMWIIRFCSRKDRLNFIKNHLYKTNSLNCQDDINHVDEFLDDYLRQDGAFLLRLVATNTNHVSTSFIITGIWDFWREKTGKAKPMQEKEVADDPEKALLLEDETKPSSPPKEDGGLKHRKPSKDELSPTAPIEKPPRKADLSRAPTMYIRGSDTLPKQRPDSDLYPKINDVNEGKPKFPDEKPESDDGNSKPSAPPSDEMTPSSDEEPHSATGDESPNSISTGTPPPKYDSIDPVSNESTGDPDVPSPTTKAPPDIPTSQHTTGTPPASPPIENAPTIPIPPRSPIPKSSGAELASPPVPKPRRTPTAPATETAEPLETSFPTEAPSESTSPATSV